MSEGMGGVQMKIQDWQSVVLHFLILLAGVKDKMGI